MRRAPSIGAAFRTNMEDVVRSHQVAAYEVMLMGERELPGMLRAELSQPGTGRLYPSRRKDGTKHRASAPGEPPAPDTGKYRASVFAKGVPLDDGRYSIGVGSREDYAELLEFGGINGQGKKVEPRPHYLPVLTRWVASRMQPALKAKIVSKESKIASKGQITVAPSGPTNVGGAAGAAGKASFAKKANKFLGSARRGVSMGAQLGKYIIRGY